MRGFGNKSKPAKTQSRKEVWEICSSLIPPSRLCVKFYYVKFFFYQKASLLNPFNTPRLAGKFPC